MRILVVDDDMFSYGEPLMWGLSCAKHEVVYCRSLNELKCGWWEITPDGIGNIRRAHVPDPVVEALEPMLMSRFESEELFESELEQVLNARALQSHGPTIRACARQEPFEPKPACVLLDMMMPVNGLYSFRQTDDGKRTGMKVLSDEDLKDKMQGLPVIIVTIDRSFVLTDPLRKDFPQIKWVLHKPIMAADVLLILGMIRKEERY